ncbi:MAG: DUF4215 domain-containing protein [Polyangiaceae bacterium]|nr:DUF4215 domain-containing protein [Polyangiaceae bacterium]
MKRWKRLGSNRFAVASFVLLTALLGASSGCGPDGSPVNPGTGGGGAGGMGGMAGAGGGTACTTADSCPGTDTVCRTRTCTDGVCGFADVPAGTPTSNQTTGDCQREVCDGMGTVTTEPDDADTLDDMNDCTADACNAGSPENTPLAAGAVCAAGSGKVCDGQGTCVECNVATDCTSLVCTSNKCVSPACVDTVKNGTETDVDCGGADCAPCTDGLVCSIASDCMSGVCTNATCAVPTCSDTVENGDETDVDCGGGTCSPCGPGLGCTQDTDCTGGDCSGAVCLPTCSDNVKNSNETDVDCGGPSCSPCADGQTCSVATDCASKVCSSGVCQAATCSDKMKNGSETGMDCGGPDCVDCPDGEGCTDGGDCASGVCSMMVCQTATCMDNTKNGLETDIDCGGGMCSPCDLGKTCTQNTDCSSSICVSGVCVDSLCGDGQTTGAEACDDGNGSAGDGCSATCSVEMGYSCVGTPSVCTAICGDGMIVGAELCDDGNTNGGDGCSATCTVESGFACTGMPSACATTCGDGIKAGAEACDDSNMNGGDCCSAICNIESGCEIEPNDSDATANAWSSVAIGNQVKAFNDPTLDKDVFSIVVPPNNKGTLTAEVKDGPLGSKCSNPTHIDSFLTVRNAAGMSLGTNDDVNPPTNYCSKVTVNNLVPGTYFVEAKRTTLAPAGLATYDYTLQVDLALVACGDGAIGAGETCDDSNVNDNDGCSSACLVEQGWGCTGQPSMCVFTCGNGTVTGNEQCDDGNTTSGDGCASNCLFEITSDVEPNNACGQTSGPFLPPFLLDGAISPIGDQDYIAITVPTYADLKIETFAPTHGSCSTGTDTIIQLRGPDCTTVLVTDDEDGINSCSLIDSNVVSDAAARHLAPGTYFIRVEEYLNNGTIAAYKLQVGFNALCGNGITEGSEQCDGGANCAADCMLLPFCGDGLIATGEQCDDGGTTGGDGCSSTCTVEADYRCMGTPSVCALYETNCSDGIDNDADGSLDAADGDCALPAYFPGCQAGETLRVYKSFDTPKSIPDNNPAGATSLVSVVNNVGNVASVAVLLSATHTWVEDVDVTLVSPTNASFDLTSDNGASSDNYTNTVLHASCPPIMGGAAPFSNCYAPEASLAPLAGTPAQGVWQLKSVDDSMDDTGTLDNWALVLCIAP